MKTIYKALRAAYRAFVHEVAYQRRVASIVYGKDPFQL